MLIVDFTRQTIFFVMSGVFSTNIITTESSCKKYFFSHTKIMYLQIC